MPRPITTNALDDRDRPLPAVPPELLEKLVWHDREPSARLRRARLVSWIFPSIAMAFAGYHVIRSPGIFLPVQWPGLIIPVIVVFTGPLLCLTTARRKKPRSPPPLREPLPPLAGLLAAHRDCGACGYDLRAITPDTDGCAPCPECGAAWHADRWTLADHPIHDSALRVGAITGKKFTGPLNTDDRGVPADITPFSLPAWLGRERVPRALSDALTTANAANHKRWRRIGFVAAGVLWVSANLLFRFLNDSAPRDLAFDTILFGFMSAAISALLFYLTSRVDLSATRCREIILAHRVCPNCRASMPADEPTPSPFDGCTPCAVCGRAWRLPA